MTTLKTLNRQLSRLRWYRWNIAWGAAFCALAIAALWSLLFLAGIDVTFQLPVEQRGAAIGLTALAAVLFVQRRVRAGMVLPENPSDLALLVERNHQLDSEFIAAMQFEQSGVSDEGDGLGSPALRKAVVERAAKLSEELNFFEHITARPLPSRLLTLAVTAGVAIALASAFPGHARVFARRLAMGKDHYPTKTQLEQIYVNGQACLAPSDTTLSPMKSTCAEGQSIELLVRTRGDLPANANARLTSSGQEVEVALKALTPRERIQRLVRAQAILQHSTGAVWRATRLAAFDCPDAVDAITLGARAEAIAAIDATIAAGEEPLASEGCFVGELPRHASSIRYQIEAGDAWTEPGLVQLIPLPTVDLEVSAQAPAYSRLGVVKMSPGARQMRVLEGSDVALRIRCLNNKTLKSAWAELTVDGEAPSRVELRPDKDGDSGEWLLSASGTSLAKISQRIQFAVHVLDEDGLQLAAPLTGQIQVRPDRPPSGSATMLHKVVLATATPQLDIRASDDFGIARLQLRILVEKPQETIETAEPGVSAADTNSESTQTLADSASPETPAVLVTINPPRAMDASNTPGSPLTSIEMRHPLPLTPLELATGDRLKITLEVVDDRGKAQGATFQADPLVLEVSDEAGVLRAVSETDEQTERKLNELYLKQLGIGEEP